MGDVERRHARLAAALEPLEAAHGVLGLAGLVILAAEDDEVVVRALVEAQVVVGIAVSQNSRSGTVPLATRPPTTYDV